MAERKLKRDIRGVDHQEEKSAKELRRDTRPLGRKILDAANTRGGGLVIFSVLTGTAFVFPQVAFLCALLAPLYWLMRSSSRKNDRLPMRLPKTAGDYVDLSEPKPGRSGYMPGAGIFYVGNEATHIGAELWLKIKDIGTHLLVFGTTGSGKTETLVSFAFNYLCMASGYAYTDPKGSPKLAVQNYQMARLLGRDMDFRLQDFATQGKPRGRTPMRLSNTINFLAYGPPESLTNVLKSLMPSSEGGNAIFGKNAENLITSLMYGLCELRDRGEIVLSVQTVRDYMEARKYDELARRQDLSEPSRSAMQAFLGSVGWDPGKPFDKQAKSFPEQYGYARAYLSQPLSNLTDTYGHIYLVDRGEIDMKDIILNRRILVTIIPYMEKSSVEIENLGQITLSAIRSAAAVGLGEIVEGTAEDVLQSLPTDAGVTENAFGVITDEYAAIPTPGFEALLTQGRSLGISAIVASQDYPGIKRADEKGAQQIVANTNLKLFMKQEDGEDTFQLIQGLTGEAKVVQSTEYSRVDANNDAREDYRDWSGKAEARDTSRVDLWDLKSQIEGEFHAVWGDSLIRGESFYAAPDTESAHVQLRIPRLLGVVLPERREVRMRYGNLGRVRESILSHCRNGDPLPAPSEVPRIIQPVLARIDLALPGAYESKAGGRIAHAVAAIMTWSRVVGNRIKSTQAESDRRREQVLRLARGESPEESAADMESDAARSPADTGHEQHPSQADTEQHRTQAAEQRARSVLARSTQQTSDGQGTSAAPGGEQGQESSKAAGLPGGVLPRGLGSGEEGATPADTDTNRPESEKTSEQRRENGDGSAGQSHAKRGWDRRRAREHFENARDADAQASEHPSASASALDSEFERDLTEIERQIHPDRVQTSEQQKAVKQKAQTLRQQADQEATYPPEPPPNPSRPTPEKAKKRSPELTQELEEMIEAARLDTGGGQ